MKKLCIFLLFFLSAGALFAQVPNSDMELWSSEPLLAGWQTNSRPLTLPPYDPYVVKKDSDSYTGNWAANLYANGVFKPYAQATFPVTIHPANLSLFYKLIFPACVNGSGYPQKDTVSVRVEVLKQGSVVDSGYWQNTVANANYTLLVIPVSQSASSFDSCRITFLGGTVSGGCSGVTEYTQFKIDHLQLKYSNQQSCIDSSLICDTCICPAYYKPVCGCNGLTYGNSCEALNAGVSSWVSGACGSNPGCIDSTLMCQGCACPQLVDPVCGCNGLTYINSCYARNAGVVSWSPGACIATGYQPVAAPSLRVNLFPNPASATTEIQMVSNRPGSVRISVVNLLGQQALSIQPVKVNAGPFTYTLPVDKLNSGLYFIIISMDNSVTVRKLVKE